MHGKILAVLDLELGHIGDPMMDLAAWRMRDTVVGYGDMHSPASRLPMQATGTWCGRCGHTIQKF